MKRIATLLSMSTVALGLLSALPLAAEGRVLHVRTGAGSAEFVPGEVVVHFNEGLDDPTVTAAVLASGAREVEWRSRFSRGLRLVKLNAGDSVERAVRRFAATPGVEFAEPNYLRQPDLQPNDPLFRVQWNLRQIGAERAWDIQQGASGVTVAVLDTGIASQDHGAFQLTVQIDEDAPQSYSIGPFRRAPDWSTTRFAPGYDALLDVGFAWDDAGHGTHVASTIAESTNNGLGLAGLAFGVTLMPIKVCWSLPWIHPGITGCPSLAVAEGIDHARTHGANVINMSLSSPFPAQVERLAVERASAANIVIVASAGNRSGPVGYPAAFPQVIAVGALNSSRALASYSSFGAELDLAAPGGDGEDRDGDGNADYVYQQTYDPYLAPFGIYDQFGYFGKSGTSMASPHVAAAAALLISQGITDARAVRRALEQGADDLGSPGRDDIFGHGLINPARALSGLGLDR